MQIKYISSPSNLYYYSLLKNNDARILIAGQKKYYITDSRFISIAKNKLKDFIVVEDKKKSLLKSAIEILKSQSFSTLGVEGDKISMNEFFFIKNSFSNTSIDDISHIISKERMQKRADELNYIKLAQEKTDKIYEKIANNLFQGITEIEVASLINKEIYIENCEPAFDTIVAFGKNTASPHSLPTKSKLREGDAVLIDFGAKYNNYCSDMTRSFSFKFASPQYSLVYNSVLAAQKHLLKILNTDILGKDIHNIGIEKLGKYGKYCTHSMGHGVGIDIHERPRLSSKSDDVLQENMVVTIEPGVYIKNNFGIRIEDLLIIKQDKACNLTKSHKNMIIK